MTDIFSCIEVESILSAYFDEELSLDEKSIVESHLIQCSECAKQLEFIKKVSNSVRNYVQNSESVCIDLNITEAVMSKLDTCRDISEDLSAFIDRELSKDRIIEISEHILQCEYCRCDYENLRVTQKAIKNYFKCSTDELQLPEKTGKESIINKIIFVRKQQKFIYSAAIAVFLVAIAYFTNLVSLNLSKKENLHNVNLVNKNKPIFTQSENYLFSSVYSEPSKEVLLLIYEN